MHGRRRRRGGVVKGCLGILGLGFVGLVILAMLMPSQPAATSNPIRTSTPLATSPAPAVPTNPVPASTPPATTPAPAVQNDSPFKPGSEVELTELLLYAQRRDWDRGQTLGKRPPNLVNGTDVFGVRVGEKASIVRVENSAALVHLQGGHWDGREGWVSVAGLRLPPTEEESANDVAARGIPLLTRRAIYKAYHEVGMEATRAANEAYPLDRVPLDNGAKYLKDHDRVYQAKKQTGRREVLRKYKLDGAQLDAIDKEGAEKQWPLE